MSETMYVWEVKAQLWRDDPYYVSSSSPVEKITVIASTRKEALSEVRKILGPAPHRVNWEFRIISAKDIRLKD